MALSLFFLSESIKVGSIYSLCQIFDLSLSAECQFSRERCGHRDRTDERSKSRDNARFGYALQGGGSRRQTHNFKILFRWELIEPTINYLQERIKPHRHTSP